MTRGRLAIERRFQRRMKVNKETQYRIAILVYSGFDSERKL